MQQTSSVDVVSDNGVDISTAEDQQLAALAIGQPKLNEEVEVEEKLLVPNNEDIVLIAKDVASVVISRILSLGY